MCLVYCSLATFYSLICQLYPCLLQAEKMAELQERLARAGKYVETVQQQEQVCVWGGIGLARGETGRGVIFL